MLRPWPPRYLVVLCTTIFRAPLNWAEQIGRGGGVVHDQWQAVLMCDLGQIFNGGQEQIRVADRFGIHRAGVGANGLAQAVEIFGIDKAHFHTQAGQGVMHKVICATIQRSRADDVIARLRQIQNGEGFGSLARCGDRRLHRLQRGEPLLGHIVGGVHQTGVGVPELFQAEKLAAYRSC